VEVSLFRHAGGQGGAKRHDIPSVQVSLEASAWAFVRYRFRVGFCQEFHSVRRSVRDLVLSPLPMAHTLAHTP